MKALLPAVLLLAACQGAVTKEGCPIYVSEMMQARTQACIAAYYEERARQSGGLVTKCTETSTGWSCTTY